MTRKDQAAATHGHRRRGGALIEEGCRDMHPSFYEMPTPEEELASLGVEVPDSVADFEYCLRWARSHSGCDDEYIEMRELRVTVANHLIYK